MARKNVRRAESGDILFDSRTKAVMSQPTQDGIKEKVLAVREVVPGRSNNEIVLVLTYYDYSVTDAIQAFLEDGAKGALEEWHFPGNKPNNKKKKKKQQKKAEQAAKEASQGGSVPASNQSAAANRDVPFEEHNKLQSTQNGPLGETEEKKESLPKDGKSPAVKVGEDEVCERQTHLSAEKTDHSQANGLPQNSACEHVISKVAEPTPSTHTRQNRPRMSESGGRSGRERTYSELSVSSVASAASSKGAERMSKTKPHAGLEKSAKDLLRQTLSLQRLRHILTEEVEKSFKKMSTVFDDLRLALNEREAELMFDMDKAKLHANEMLHQRQERAAELKICTDKAQVMSDSELSELRADIKHFVSERKIDEDLTKSARFVCEADQLLEQIKSFGEVSHVKHGYSRRRPSTSSVSSSVVSHDEPLTPLTPTTPSTLSTAPFPSNQSAGTPSVPSSDAQTAASVTEKFASAVSLEDTRAPTPTHKSAGTSPHRPPRSASPTTVRSQPMDTDDVGVRRPKNARRRQRQRLRERENESLSREFSSNVTTPSDFPSNDLEKKQRSISNGPKHVANRGTSPMKHPATSTHGKPELQSATQRTFNQHSGQGPRPHQYSHKDQSSPIEDGASRKHQNSGQNQDTYRPKDRQYQDYGYNHGQGPKRHRDGWSRNTGTPAYRNRQYNRPVNGVVNGPVSNLDSSQGGAPPHTNPAKTLNRNSPDGKSSTAHTTEEVSDTTNKGNTSLVSTEKQDSVGNNHKLIENGAEVGAAVKSLPQRGPRNRGTRHALEKHKSQIIVNGESTSGQTNRNN